MTMPLPFEPACLPLLLGSLPHRNAAQALELTRRYTGALLAWPQLPQRSAYEGGLLQSAGGLPGLVVEAGGTHVYFDRALAERQLNQLSLAFLENDLTYAALGEDDAAGLAEVLRQPEVAAAARAIKGQLLGPLSLALRLTDERQQPLIYDRTLLEALAQHVRLRAMWQEMQLGELNGTTIICLDEPFLDVIGLPFLPLEWDDARELLDEALGGVTGCRALVAAGAPDWQQVLRTSAELVIADVLNYASTLSNAASALAGFLARDGMLGLGIVPFEADALQGATAASLVQQIDTLLAGLATAGVDTQLLLRRAVVAPAGGLGRLTIEGAERAVQLVREVSDLLRAQHGLA